MKEIDRWNKDGGDDKFRYTYNLTEDSVVFDCGGYMGKWSEKIYDMYGCNIYIFEPIKKYFNIIKEKFKDNGKIKVCAFGVSNLNKEINITLSDDGSSTHIDGVDVELIRLVDIKEFVDENKIEKIDLLKLNIEGEEYNVMERIIEADLLDRINNYQIQFHKFIDDCEIRRNNIRDSINKTHNEIYCYEFIWESWEKK